jgi:hypothetical protein
VLERGIRLALVAVFVAADFLFPGAAKVVTAAGTPAPGFAVTDFATGFNTFIPFGPGPIGVAFDAVGNLYSTAYYSGGVYRFPPSGGTFETSRLGSVGYRVTGLAFDRSGRLFVARQGEGDILELNPSDASVKGTVASGICNPNAVVVDPLSGDLFISSCGTVQRLHGYQGSAVQPTLYSTNVSVDGLTFAPDGTLFGAGGGPVYRISGTSDSAPGTATPIANVPTGDGIALVAPAPGSPITQLAVNRNDGIITLVDFSVQPASMTNIVTGGSRGDFVGVGPDKCLYATQSDEIEKVTAADGSCPFLPTGVAKPPSRYVALGDSYSSGHGAGNYFPNTNTTTNKCHRSLNAYPLLLASAQYGVNLPSEIDFGACSGATINNFYSGFWNEGPQLDVICAPKPYVQPAAGAPAPCTDGSVQLVTLGVGGDDLGFADVLEACVTNRKDQQRCLGQDSYVTFGGQVPEQDAGCNTFCVQDKDPSYRGIERIEHQLRQLYMDIRGRAPHARIVVLGYPRLFPVGGRNDDFCHLSPTDQVWLTAKDQEVNGLIRFAVNASGVAEYADTFNSMSGHEACQGLNASIPWVNGPQCPGFACDESFHPTKDGQKAFASSVASQLLTSPPGPCGSGCTWLSRLVSHSDTFQLQVPAGTAVASFASSWSVKDDVVMDITSPSGQVFTRSSGGALNHSVGDGYEYYNLPDGDPTLVDPNSTVPSVASGTWTVSLSTAALKPVAVIFALGLSAQRDPTPKAEATFNGTVITRGGLLHTEVFAIVRFDAKPSSDLDGKIVGYTWNFGDGMTGTGAHVEHKYSNAGKFCPLLTVTDDSGQIGYAAGRILVGTNDPGDCV